VLWCRVLSCLILPCNLMSGCCLALSLVLVLSCLRIWRIEMLVFVNHLPPSMAWGRLLTAKKSQVVAIVLYTRPVVFSPSCCLGLVFPLFFGLLWSFSCLCICFVFVRFLSRLCLVFVSSVPCFCLVFCIVFAFSSTCFCLVVVVVVFFVFSLVFGLCLV
jgi:hypothetical protein